MFAALLPFRTKCSRAPRCLTSHRMAFPRKFPVKCNMVSLGTKYRLLDDNFAPTLAFPQRLSVVLIKQQDISVVCIPLQRSISMSRNCLKYFGKRYRNLAEHLCGEEDKCLHVALPVAAILEMLTKSVNSRATTATRTGCVRHGVGHQTPFSGRGSRNATEDLRPNILQLNTEGLTADKISVIEQLTYKNKAFITVLQETHCTTADKLVIPNF